MGGGEAAPAPAGALAPGDTLPAEFDKEQFRHVIKVKALRVPAKQCHPYMRRLSE